MPINPRQSGHDSPGAEKTRGQRPLSESESESKLETQTHALTLLLVEDDLLSRSMLKVRVTRLFKQVFEAADGTEALELFCRHLPDIVLTDQVMQHRQAPGFSCCGRRPPVSAPR